RLEKDLERITEYYRNHGYAEARIGTPVVEMDYVVEPHMMLFRHQYLSPQFHISVPLSEGIFYKLGAVEVHDDVSTARISERTDALVANSGLKPGAPYSQRKIVSLRDELSQSPLSSAKADSLPSGVDVSRELDTANGTAKTVFLIHPPNPHTLRRLNFSGERRFSDRYYRRRIPLREGEPFDSEKLRSGLERLVRTGYVRSFKPEDVRMQFDDANHSVDIVIRVAEVGQQKISLTGGWNNLGGTIGAAYSVFNLLGGQELIDSHIDVGPDSLHLALR